MNLVKREKIMLVAAGCVAVIALVYQFVLYPASQEKSKPVKKATVQKQNTTKKTIKNVPTNVQQSNTTKKLVSANVRNYDKWGRDPFSTTSTRSRSGSGTSTQKKPSHTLKAIFWKQGKPYALIDDDIILSEGEQGSGLEILRITEKKVDYRKGGRTYSLYLKED